MLKLHAALLANCHRWKYRYFWYACKTIDCKLIIIRNQIATLIPCVMIWIVRRITRNFLVLIDFNYNNIWMLLFYLKNANADIYSNFLFWFNLDLIEIEEINNIYRHKLLLVYNFKKLKINKVYLTRFTARLRKTVKLYVSCCCIIVIVACHDNSSLCLCVFLFYQSGNPVLQNIFAGSLIFVG